MSRPVVAAIIVLLLLAAASTARDFCLPGKEQQEIRKRDFAVWFWGSMERDHEVVCLRYRPEADLCAPGCFWQNLHLAAISLQRTDLLAAACSAARALTSAAYRDSIRWRCVQYWSHQSPYDQAAFDRLARRA